MKYCTVKGKRIDKSNNETANTINHS